MTEVNLCRINFSGMFLDMIQNGENLGFFMLCMFAVELQLQSNGSITYRTCKALKLHGLVDFVKQLSINVSNRRQIPQYHSDVKPCGVSG